MPAELLTARTIPTMTSPATCRLTDLPSDSLPRERLLKEGRAALSDEELLAIFLRTGLPGCNVLELASRIKRAAGSLAALGSMEAAELADLHKGMGKAKAATLAAVFELGQRAARENVERNAIRSAQDVYDLLVGELRYETQEVMVLLLLDTKRMLLRKERIAVGTLTRLLVHPRNVFGPALLHKAARVIIAHNHPSGDCRPSNCDRELTAALSKAAEVLCLPLADHVIIGAPVPGYPRPYYSFAEEGLL